MTGTLFTTLIMLIIPASGWATFKIIRLESALEYWQRTAAEQKELLKSLHDIHYMFQSAGQQIQLAERKDNE